MTGTTTSNLEERNNSSEMAGNATTAESETNIEKETDDPKVARTVEVPAVAEVRLNWCTQCTCRNIDLWLPFISIPRYVYRFLRMMKVLRILLIKIFRAKRL